MAYLIPALTTIGHVHLKVSNIEKALAFYVDILGFSITQRYGDSAVFISAGGYHHHIGLNTWESKNGVPPPRNATGLYHTAILYPTKKDLAIIVQRLIDVAYPLTGSANHGVSLAIYLNDPDGNGVELYWDLPKEVWPLDSNENIKMGTEALDWNDLLHT
jgi:catechol 2,3-dioxygenase